MSAGTLVVSAIIVIYLAVCLWLGYIAYKRGSNSTQDYFIAAGTMPPFIMMATFVATQFSSYTFLGGAGYFFSDNIMPGMSELIIIVMSPLSLIFAVRIYKASYYHKMTTVADLISARFNSRAAVVFSAIVLGLLVSLAFSVFYVSIQLIGSAYTLSGLTGGELKYMPILIFFTVIMAVYTSLGGFRAVAYTDTLQLVMCFIFLSVLGYIVVAHYGGLGDMFEKAIIARPDAFQIKENINYLGIVAPVVFIGYLYMPHMTIRLYSARNLKGVMYMIVGCALAGTIMLVFLSPITGSAISIFAPNGIEGVSNDQLLVRWALKYLGPVGAAIIMSGAIAASFSTADSLLLMGASVIINDICIRTLKVDWDAKKAMYISRFVVITMILLAFFGALNPKLGIMRMMLKLTFPSYTVLVPCVVAIFWSKANSKGIITGLTLGSIAAIAQALGFVSPPFGVYSLFYNVIITSLGIVIVSLATGGPTKEESLEVFQNPPAAV